MGGRDPHEPHRVASPLELLFDLTFATCFGLAASQLAEATAAGHYASALLGFGFATFGICWAWSNFSWFSSAYDTDDWIFRIATMVQMMGVLVLTIGLPRVFASIERGQHLDNSVMVLGYVIMRVALTFQWLRAARQDPGRRRVCLTYAATVAIAQVGWVMQIIVAFSTLRALVLGCILALIELAGPVLAERLDGGTPWHAHHIAERHSLFALIALGEGVMGTVAALSAVVDQQGWTLEAALIGTAGTGLVFGMWWVYMLEPSAAILRRHRNRAAVWSGMQMLIVTSIVATGAGLHVAAYFIEHKAQIPAVTAVLAVSIPVLLFLALLHALYHYLVRRFRSRDAWLLITSSAIVAVSVVAALFDTNMAGCLVLLTLAPTVTLIVFEVSGYRDHATAQVGEEHGS